MIVQSCGLDVSILAESMCDRRLRVPRRGRTASVHSFKLALLREQYLQMLYIIMSNIIKSRSLKAADWKWHFGGGRRNWEELEQDI